MKDLWISLGVGVALGLFALVAMLSSDRTVPAIVAITLGILGAMAVSLFRMGPGIRHLVTGMERDRVEIAKATEELRKLLSRIREPNKLEIEMYGGSSRLMPTFEERERLSRLEREV